MTALPQASTPLYEAGDFFGEPLWKRAAQSFTLGMWASDNRWQAPEAHGHDTAHLVFVWGGPYQTTARGEALSGFTPLIYNPPGTYHRDRFQNCVGGFFSITVDHQTSMEAQEWSLPEAAMLSPGPLAYAIVHRLMAEGGSSGPSLTVESLCLLLMDEWANRRPRERGWPRWLRDACDLISDRHSENFGFKELADTVGVSAMHLNRTFRSALGCTPGEYLRSRRLATAIDLLSRSRMSLVEIALHAGFADQSHLTKHFTRTYGMPPGAYRRIVRG